MPATERAAAHLRFAIPAVGLLLGLLGEMTWAQDRNAPPPRPNIVWIIAEDMSPNFGCYGETAIETPNVDRLAAEGARFTNAIVTAPVCSACRSALICGMYQTSIGAHHHRSGRGALKISLPEDVRLVPALFKEAGYLTLNLGFGDFTRSADKLEQNQRVRIAKTDYNFEWDRAVYDRTHWSASNEETPFFVQVQLHGGKLRGKGIGDRWPARVQRELGSRTAEDAVHLSPDLPADPVILQDWAQYLDTVRYTDWQVGRIIDCLRAAGELERSYVFFITDHGISHVRHKQFCYDGGIRIPLMVRGPGIEAGTVRSDPVEHIDLAATALALAGIRVPPRMQARDVLAADYRPRRYAFAARDRCDETVDRIRAVRDARYKYIRNFHPLRPYLQPNAYKDGKPIVQTLRRLHAAGSLSPTQALVMAETRPPEELYDLRADPHELRNLAGDSAHREVLERMRQALERWIIETGDSGQAPESPAMYASDMAIYAPRNVRIRENIAIMKQWAAEGR